MTGPLAAAAATVARPVVVAPPAAAAAGVAPVAAAVVVPEVLAVLLATKRYIPSQREERGNHLDTGRFQPTYLTTRHISTKFFWSTRVQPGQPTTGRSCNDKLYDTMLSAHTQYRGGGGRETNKRERGGEKGEAKARLSSRKSSKDGNRAQLPGFVVLFFCTVLCTIQYVPHTSNCLHWLLCRFFLDIVNGALFFFLWKRRMAERGVKTKYAVSIAQDDEGAAMMQTRAASDEKMLRCRHECGWYGGFCY